METHIKSKLHFLVSIFASLPILPVELNIPQNIEFSLPLANPLKLVHLLGVPPEMKSASCLQFRIVAPMCINNKYSCWETLLNIWNISTERFLKLTFKNNYYPFNLAALLQSNWESLF